MNILSFCSSSKFLAFLLIFSVLGCNFSKKSDISSINNKSSNSNSLNSNAELNYVPTGMAEEGLDLQAVTELARKAKDAADLEKQLNQPDSVNNLDLDENGKVDYIHVSEFRNSPSNARGYSLTVDLGKGNIQEVATIILERDDASDQTIDVYTAGNEQIYGYDDYYAGTWNYSDAPFSDWAYNSHDFYTSPYRYGLYPAGFVAFATVTALVYRSKIKSYYNSAFKKVPTITTKNSLTSPNKGKFAANIKAPLQKPTTAQSSYQAKNPSKTGFGSNPYSSSSSTKSTTTSTYSSNSSGSKTTPPSYSSTPYSSSSTPKYSSTPYSSSSSSSSYGSSSSSYSSSSSSKSSSSSSSSSSRRRR